MTHFARRPSARRSRGQTLVEFAMIMPIILVVILGLLDLGRAVFSYNTLSQAARRAAASRSSTRT